MCMCINCVCVCACTCARKPTITDKVVKPDLRAAELPDMKGKCKQSQRVLSGHQYSLMRDHREDHNACNLRLYDLDTILKFEKSPNNG